MLSEYQEQGQQVQDGVQQAFDALENLRQTLADNYPEEERTYRMGRVMTTLGEVSIQLNQVLGKMQQIEWPTEERPR